jgi:hypothetical protein
VHRHISAELRAAVFAAYGAPLQRDVDGPQRHPAYPAALARTRSAAFLRLSAQMVLN